MKLQRTRVKFCGLTTKDAVDQAVLAGADALGFVFYEPSVRYVSPDLAKQISEQVPAFVTKVALVVNASAEQLEQVCLTFEPDLIQFHGNETAADCSTLAARVNKPWIKALRVKAGMDLNQLHREFTDAGARGVLLDAYDPNHFGGTGVQIQTKLLAHMQADYVLAGGLNPKNLAQALLNSSAYAVDVSSGIESSAGVKDPRLMQDFIHAVRASDQNRLA